MRAIAASLEDGKGASWPPVIDDEPKPEKDSETSLNGEMIYPPLPEEPKSSRELCKIAIRLPDGRRIRRNFLPTDSTKVVDLIRNSCPCFHSYLFTRLTWILPVPMQLLWSLCSSQLADGQKRPFHFAEAIPGTLKSLEYANNLTFEEAGLSNKMITLILDWYSEISCPRWKGFFLCCFGSSCSLNSLYRRNVWIAYWSINTKTTSLCFDQLGWMPYRHKL